MISDTVKARGHYCILFDTKLSKTNAKPPFSDFSLLQMAGHALATNVRYFLKKIIRTTVRTINQTINKNAPILTR